MFLTFPTGDVDTATPGVRSGRAETEGNKRSLATRRDIGCLLVKHLKVSSVVMPRFPRLPPGSKNPIEFCYQKLGIVERPSTPEALVKTMDSPEFTKCMTWAPKDTDAHVPIPSAMELLERIPPERR
jgi:hypothetical protein